MRFHGERSRNEDITKRSLGILVIESDILPVIMPSYFHDDILLILFPECKVLIVVLRVPQIESFSVWVMFNSSSSINMIKNDELMSFGFSQT